MKSSSTDDYSDLHQRYRDSAIDLYKVFSKYVLISMIAIVAFEACKALLNSNISFAMVSFSVSSITALFLKWIMARKDTFEIPITIFYILFYSTGLVAESTKEDHFSSTHEAFIFGYGYCLAERLITEHMSNINHRIFFSIFALGFRMFLHPEAEVSTYMKQCWLLLFTILMDLYRERHAKAFFFSYCNSKEQLNKFKDLVEKHIPEAIVIASEDLSKSMFVNNSFLRLIQGTKPTLESQLKGFLLKEEAGSTQNISVTLGNTLLDFIRASSLADGASCIVTLHKTTASDDRIFNQDRKPNRLLFEVKLSKIIWDDQPCIAIILHDVTEHHTILSLKIADAQKDKVLATVSHELKTPLNGMLGMIQVMEKKIKDTELLRFLTICKSSTSLLISLVCSILDLNQLRADKMKLNKQKVDVGGLVKEVIGLFEYQCQQKGIYLITKILPGTPKFLYTDKERLSQVLINLVGNAQKFTSKGGILVSISEGEKENSVKFIIQDTGIGISQQDQEKLFQVFGKLSQEDERINRQGVGLGLTIAESLVKALNDRRNEVREISVESEQGRGCIFSFTIRPVEKRESRLLLRLDTTILPTIPNEKDDSPCTSAPYHSPLRDHIWWNSSQKSATSSPKRTLIYSQLSQPSNVSRQRHEDRSTSPCILLVDDNLFNIAVAEHLVVSHGYRVKTALSGLEAIDIVNNNNHVKDQIILILMDCQMPIMDGYEATRILRKMMQDKKVPTIPIVALTANDSEEDKEVCRKSGMCDHLSKPLKDRELERVLKKYC